jgi:hypothetical protein
MTTIVQTREVSMNAKKRREKLRSIVDSKAQVCAFAQSLSENQKRFLHVGLSLGKELEPVGPMAGSRS